MCSAFFCGHKSNEVRKSVRPCVRTSDGTDLEKISDSISNLRIFEEYDYKAIGTGIQRGYSNGATSRANESRMRRKKDRSV